MSSHQFQKVTERAGQRPSSWRLGGLEGVSVPGFNGNLSPSCGDISVWSKVLDWHWHQQRHATSTAKIKLCVSSKLWNNDTVSDLICYKLTCSNIDTSVNDRVRPIYHNIPDDLSFEFQLWAKIDEEKSLSTSASVVTDLLPQSRAPVNSVRRWRSLVVKDRCGGNHCWQVHLNRPAAGLLHLIGHPDAANKIPGEPQLTCLVYSLTSDTPLPALSSVTPATPRRVVQMRPAIGSVVIERSHVTSVLSCSSNKLNTGSTESMSSQSTHLSCRWRLDRSLTPLTMKTSPGQVCLLLSKTIFRWLTKVIC